jgi:hypothetical protein
LSTSISRSDSSARIVAASCSLGRDQRLPDRRRANPLHQLLDGGVLHQVAAGPREDRVHHVLVLVGDRQDDDAGQRGLARHLTRRFDARHPWHVQVHHDHVRRELAHHAHGLHPVARLADDLHGLLLEQVPQAGPKEVVVVDQQDTQVLCRTGRCRCGIWLLDH